MLGDGHSGATTDDQCRDFLVSPSVWLKAGLPSFSALDQDMRCPICSDFLQAPVSLPCGHCFCSLCIRRSLDFREACPSCRVRAHAGELKPNRALEVLLGNFVCARREVVAALADSPSERVRSALDGVPEGFALRVRQQDKVQGKPPTRECGVMTELSMWDVEGEKKEPVEQVEMVDLSEGSGGAPSNKVSCPICGVWVSESLVNAHIDNCLRRQQDKKQQRGSAGGSSALLATAPVSSSSSSFSSSSSRSSTSGKRAGAELRKMPNLCYNLLNQRQLVRRMMDVGLPVQGSRNEMIRRHREFTLQFNAALDSSRPKTPQQVVQHILREEGNSKQKGPGRPPSTVAAPRPVEQKRKKLFSQLIREVRSRMGSAKKDKKQEEEEEEEAAAVEADLSQPLVSPVLGKRTLEEKEGEEKEETEKEEEKESSKDPQSPPPAHKRPAPSPPPCTDSSDAPHKSASKSTPASQQLTQGSTSSSSSSSAGVRRRPVVTRRSMRRQHRCSTPSTPPCSSPPSPAASQQQQQEEGDADNVDDDDDFQVTVSMASQRELPGITPRRSRRRRRPSARVVEAAQQRALSPSSPRVENTNSNSSSSSSAGSDPPSTLHSSPDATAVSRGQPQQQQEDFPSGSTTARRTRRSHLAEQYKDEVEMQYLGSQKHDGLSGAPAEGDHGDLRRAMLELLHSSN